MKIRFASIDEILPLRQAVIIAGTNRTIAHFDGDDAPTTRHVGVFEDDGTCIGCATYLRSEWDGRPAWQLRGMAIAPEHQGQGIGTALLRFAEDALRREVPAIDTFWCNARESAVGFYERNGWRTVGERFVIEGVGPHYRMWR